MSNSKNDPPADVGTVTNLSRNPPWRGLFETIQKTEARISWTDRSGFHEVTITGPATLGSYVGRPLCVDDPTVSRLHLNIEPRKAGVFIRDVGSTNGTFFEGARVWELQVRDGARLTVGETEIRIRQSPAAVPTPLWPGFQFGPLLGKSAVMRELFQTLSQFAQSDATVLIHGETGTGKELVAQAIHEKSSRADGEFVIVDCGAIQEQLFEAELFGHTRGAFTGATEARTGSILAADGGTLFLDEVGEVPLSMQPKLLRALESKTVKRLGENGYRNVNVRYIAASHRDLREMVNAGTFREDLYFRLAVLTAEVPPLRARPDDVTMLVQHFLPPERANALNENRATELTSRPWSGNVRELRNFADRVTALGWDRALGMGGAGAPTSVPPPALAPVADGRNELPASWMEGAFTATRERLIDLWERGYVQALLARFNGNVVAAAEGQAAVTPSYLRRVIKRLGM